MENSQISSGSITSQSNVSAVDAEVQARAEEMARRLLAGLLLKLAREAGRPMTRDAAPAAPTGMDGSPCTAPANGSPAAAPGSVERYLDALLAGDGHRMRQEGEQAVRFFFFPPKATPPRRSNPSSTPPSQVFFLFNPESPLLALTPQSLGGALAPYLQALFALQHQMDRLKTPDSRQETQLVSLAQGEQIRVETRGAPDALQAVRDHILPVRRKYHQGLKRLGELQIALEKPETESDSGKDTPNSPAARQEADQLQQLMLEECVRVTSGILHSLQPGLPAKEAGLAEYQLLPIIKNLVESPLELLV